MSTPPSSLNKPSVAGIEHDALPPGTRFGEFEIVRVLGVGGFGIVYLAKDHSLERDVALKEYMPASLAARGIGPQITVRSSSLAETYAIGLRSFINEARLLARFDHPSLVKVYRFWEDNATAYMVMPYLVGVTLRDVRRGMAHGPDEAWTTSVILPILSALELLHREGVYHRDIAPDNILLPREGPPVLLDFGAARRVISDRTQSLTAILKPSYAPIEQYAEMAQMRQGPWTDLYALGAVVHYLLFGAPPAPATARAVQDEGDALEQRSAPGVSPRFIEAMAWMLAVRPNQRPQSVEQLRAVLEGRAEIPERRAGTTILGLPVNAAAPVDGTLMRTAQIPTFVPTTPAPPPTSFAPTAVMPSPHAATETALMPTSVLAARTAPLPAPAPPATPSAPVAAGAPLAAAMPPAAEMPPVAATPPAVAATRVAASRAVALGAATTSPRAARLASGVAARSAVSPARVPVPPATARAGNGSRAARVWLGIGAGVVVAAVVAAFAWQFSLRRDNALAAEGSAASAAASGVAVQASPQAPAAATKSVTILVESAPPAAPAATATIDAATTATTVTHTPAPVDATALAAPAHLEARPHASGRPVPHLVRTATGASTGPNARAVDN
ncbi:MAG: serine/threonine-protein kinase, partial [Caldimonas sp.]